MYEARGLIEPSRSPKGTRLYSQSDVERLRRIQQMTAELGLNLAGVERVRSRSRAELDVAHDARGVSMARKAEHWRAAELAGRSSMRLRRSMSADIVRYSGSSTTLVRAADARSPFRPPARDRARDR